MLTVITLRAIQLITLLKTNNLQGKAVADPKIQQEKEAQFN